MPALSRTGPGATLLTPGTVVVLALVLVLTPFLATTGAGPPPVPFGNDRLAPQADRTDAAGTPGGAVGSIQITLQNSLAVPTGPYQQKIVLDSSSFSDLINSNWSNGIAFYTSNDTPVYGWLESNATNASSQTVLYLRLGSIPAGGSTEVSIFFWAKNSFNLSASGYMGEAPELSPVYGEFDNGAQVFNLYDDFARTTLGPSWLVHGSWPATLSDGFTVSAVPGQGDTIVSSARFPYPAVVDFYGDLYQSNPASAYYSEGMGSGGCPSCGNASTVGWSSQGSGNGPRPSTASGSSGTGGSSVYPTQTYAVFTTEAISSTQATFLANYTDAQNLTQAIPSGPLPVSLAGTGAPPGGLTNPSTTQWIRERSYVAQMPTAQYSEVRLYPVTFTESGLPTGTGWWVNVTGGPSVYSQTTTLPFSEPTGSFAYVVATLDKTYASPSGTFEVSTAPASVPLTFSLVTYPITFTESGLPTGMGWWANVTGGPTSFSTTGTVSVSEPNGTYTYSLAAATRIYEAPGGPVTVDGAPVSIAVDFSPVTYGVTFTETGLPGGNRMVGQCVRGSLDALRGHDPPVQRGQWVVRLRGRVGRPDVRRGVRFPDRAGRLGRGDGTILPGGVHRHFRADRPTDGYELVRPVRRGGQLWDG